MNEQLSKRRSLERILAQDVKPSTIIDVGFATGTSGLYGVFEDVRHVIIEPLEESRPFIDAVKRKYPDTVAVEAGAGRKAGKASFIVAEGLSGSSFVLKAGAGSAREVPIVTIDQVVIDNALAAPFLLKLDVQGFELEALSGAEETLRDCVAVIVEVSLWGDRKKNLPSFVEVINWFDQHGFVLFDLCQIVRRKRDDAITEMDMLFCPKDSPLRSASAYKASADHEQIVQHKRAKFNL